MPVLSCNVSLCMIVKDEEANLAACLAPVAGLVREIIVVDTGSTDRTREIAARFGARIVDFPWKDSFSAARNESLRQASSDWIFWMDADDRLDPENCRRLQQLFVSLPSTPAGYLMSCVCGPDPSAAGVLTLTHLRLFPRLPQLRWHYRVHEMLRPPLPSLGIPVYQTDIVLYHVGYQNPEIHRRKVERNLRLLEQDFRDEPDDPYTLYHLGRVYMGMGRSAEAASLLRRCLELAPPGAAYPPQACQLLANLHLLAGQPDEAWAVCLEGRRRFPDDADLRFLEAMMRCERRDVAGAEAVLRDLVQTGTQPGERSSVRGLLGPLARHNLAVIYRGQGRLTEAEQHWKQIVRAQPDYVPAWMGLGDLYLAQGRWAELEQLAAAGRAGPRPWPGAVLLQARLLMKRREFTAARQMLEAVIADAPRLVEARIVYSHVLIEEGRDWPAAVRALEAVLALNPRHAQSLQNLQTIRAWQQQPQQQ